MPVQRWNIPENHGYGDGILNTCLIIQDVNVSVKIYLHQDVIIYQLFGKFWAASFL